MNIPATMKALVKSDRKRGLTLSEVPVPKITDDEVLIKVAAASICGTDMHLYNWDGWAAKRVRKFPFIQGHELCGHIARVGNNVDILSPGDFVSAESHVVDYGGAYYKNGLGHVAPETKIIGVDRDGAFADYIALPWQNARKNPNDMPTNIAVLKENFGNAVHCAFAADVKDKVILVTGCGPAGLMLILALKARGARSIIASDISDYRVSFAKRLGADVVINPVSDDFEHEIAGFTKGAGVDVFYEMSGAESAFLSALPHVICGGKIVLFGIFPGKITFDINNLLIFKGISMHAIIGRKLWETWEQSEELLDSGKVDLSPIITHTFKIEDYKEAFATMESGESGKVMLTL